MFKKMIENVRRVVANKDDVKQKMKDEQIDMNSYMHHQIHLHHVIR